MIPLNFYRDDEYAYYNNPKGITKKMTIAEFEAVFDANASELPAYTSSDSGKVLTVNSGGTGVEWGEGGGGGGVLNVNCSVEQGTHGEITFTLDKTWKEIKDAFTAGTNVVVLRTNETELTMDTLSLIGKYTYDDATSYQVGIGFGNNAIMLLTPSENGYPKYVST